MRLAVAAVVIGSVGLAAFGIVQSRSTSHKAQAPVTAPAPAAQVEPAKRAVVVTASPISTPSAVASPPASAQAMQTAALGGSAQTAAASTAPAAAPAAAAAPSPAPAAPPVAQIPQCSNPNALGTSRVVEVDTTGGPGFGFEHFRQHDFLRDHEIVLTFDDGPWQTTTPAVLKALAEHCVRAVFFPIGKHATYYPEILKQVAAAGHTVGSHTWSHVDLSRKTAEEAKEEIEKGFSAVRMAIGAAGAPFFRFPALKHPPEIVTYLGERGVGIFSTDLDSFDFKMRRSEQVIESVMNKLKKNGKGIVLMHDFQGVTAEAVPALLARLKAEGYKVVHMKAREQVKTLAQFDELVMKDTKLPTVSSRPTSSVIRTVTE